MSKPKFLAFDTETGGLDPQKNPILTAYFAVIGEDYGLMDELYLFIRPEDPFSTIDSQAMSVNKIDLSKHIEDPKTLNRKEASEKLKLFLSKYQPKKSTGVTSKLRPIAHNIDFDLNMIRAQLLSFSEWENLVHYGKLDTKMIVDFLKDAGWLPPELGRLESVARHFEVPISEAHEARNDTLMMVESYRKMVEMLENKKNSDSMSLDIISMLEK